MNKIQIKQLNDRLDKLQNFSFNKQAKKSNIARRILNGKKEFKEFKESEILDWLAECTSFFTEVGVSHAVIDNFLKFFNFSKEQDEDGLVKRIGPFVTVGVEEKIYELSGIVDFDYTKIAFRCAKSSIDKLVEDEKIVPSWLIYELSINNKTKNISSSLELVENCYQTRDENGIIMNTNNLLDIVLNLDQDLKGKGENSIGKKLNLLSEDKDKLKKFGISKDVVVALNGFRLIRNKKIAHKDTPLKCDIPFIVAISFVYLAIFFLECFVLNSDIFKKEKNI